MPFVAAVLEKHLCAATEAVLMRLIKLLLSDGPPPITWDIMLFSSTQGVALRRAPQASRKRDFAVSND